MKDHTFEMSMQRSLSFSLFVAATHRILLVKRKIIVTIPMTTAEPVTEANKNSSEKYYE
jgi:hypothetical protein